MSKSRGNVVVPDTYIQQWGADTFRTYLMFLGPYQEGGDFRDQGLQGPYGLLSRLWGCIVPADQLAMLTDRVAELQLQRNAIRASIAAQPEGSLVIVEAFINPLTALSAWPWLTSTSL